MPSRVFLLCAVGFYTDSEGYNMPADVIGLVYAGLVTLGGVMGYVKAGSAASFIAGAATGLAAAFGAWNSNFYVLAAVSGFLTAVMGIRYYNSGKVMPAGMVAVLSALILCRSLYVLSRGVR